MRTDLLYACMSIEIVEYRSHPVGADASVNSKLLHADFVDSGPSAGMTSQPSPSQACREANIMWPNSWTRLHAQDKNSLMDSETFSGSLRHSQRRSEHPAEDVSSTAQRRSIPSSSCGQRRPLSPTAIARVVSCVFSVPQTMFCALGVDAVLMDANGFSTPRETPAEDPPKGPWTPSSHRGFLPRGPSLVSSRRLRRSRVKAVCFL